MRHVQLYIPHPPRPVWDAILDPASWWEPPDEPVDIAVGTRFEMKAVPVVGTRFTGEFEIEVLEVVPCKRLITSLLAHAEPGPPAEWRRETTFREHEGGTLLAVANKGIRGFDRDERLLLSVLQQIQAKELQGVAELLDQPRP